jgi:hypothetical protein
MRRLHLLALVGSLACSQVPSPQPHDEARRTATATPSAGIMSDTAQGQGREEEVASGSEYFPEARPGAMECEYDVSYHGTQTNENGTGKAVRRPLGAEQIGNHEYQKTVTAYQGIPAAIPETTYWRVAPDGIYAVAARNKALPEQRAVPLPLAIGTSWTLSGSSGRCDYRVEGKEPVDLIARRYEDAIKISRTCATLGFVSTTVEYRAQGIGRVKLSLYTALGSEEDSLKECHRR